MDYYFSPAKRPEELFISPSPLDYARIDDECSWSRSMERITNEDLKQCVSICPVLQPIFLIEQDNAQWHPIAPEITVLDPNTDSISLLRHSCIFSEATGELYIRDGKRYKLLPEALSVRKKILIEYLKDAVRQLVLSHLALFPQGAFPHDPVLPVSLREDVVSVESDPARSFKKLEFYISSSPDKDLIPFSEYISTANITDLRNSVSHIAYTAAANHRALSHPSSDQVITA